MSNLRIRKLTPKELLFYIMGLCGIIDNIGEQIYEERIRPLLSILWKEIGKEEIWQEIRRFWSIQQKEILQPNLYEQSIFESWGQYSKGKKCSLIFQKNSREDITSGKYLCNLWENWKSRYTPHRWELSQQQFEQFNAFMSQLPYETTQEEKNLCDMWETSARFGVLQQTLFKIQEIWRPTLPQEQSSLRIRKLSPLECLKLMGFSKEDYNAISKEFGNSAIYHVAGDTIITTCLVSIFGTMLDVDYRTKVENYVESLKEG